MPPFKSKVAVRNVCLRGIKTVPPSPAAASIVRWMAAVSSVAPSPFAPKSSTLKVFAAAKFRLEARLHEATNNMVKIRNFFMSRFLIVGDDVRSLHLI